MGSKGIGTRGPSLSKSPLTGLTPGLPTPNKEIMQALLDMDLVVYRCAASSEKEEEEVALQRMDKLIQDLLQETNSTSYRAFLTGNSNFRKQLCPTYKANRKDVEPPKWLQQCREYAVASWNSEITDGCEADDALAIAQKEDTTIVSLDKDLMQIPGKHYRWSISGTTAQGKQWTKEAEWLDISYINALRHFYSSCLIGDRADNIIGVAGIGPAKAEKHLLGCETEQEMFDVCRNLYKDDKHFFLNLQLLWLWREEDDIFCPKKRNLIHD